MLDKYFYLENVNDLWLQKNVTDTSLTVFLLDSRGCCWCVWTEVEL